MFKQVLRFNKQLTQVVGKVGRANRYFSTSQINHVEVNKLVVTVPNLSDSIQQLQISKLDIAEKDVIKKDQLIASFKTKYETMEWKSQHSGTVIKVFLKEGQAIKNGQPFYELELSENQESEEDPITKLTKIWNKLPPAAKYVIIFAIICESLVYIRLLF